MYIDQPFEPHFGELGFYCAARHFGLRSSSAAAALAERAFQLTVEMHSDDLSVLKEAVGTSRACDPNWAGLDQLAHLYNIICLRSEVVAPGYHYRRPLLIAGVKQSTRDPGLPGDHEKIIQIAGVLMFGNGNRGRLARMMDILVQEHPLHRSSLITSLSAEPIGRSSLADALH